MTTATATTTAPALPARVPLRRLLRELGRGKSLPRSLTNEAAAGITLRGRGMDLGARDGTSSYFRFFALAEGAEVSFSDLDPGADGVATIDLEQGIPVPDASQDFLLLMNVLEHIYDYRTCLAECCRVLKPGAPLIGCVPFLMRVHPDPDDFFRYTHSSLVRMLTEAGFGNVTVSPLGFGPLTAGVHQWSTVLRPRLLLMGASAVALAGDRLLERVRPGSRSVGSVHFPLAYFFVAVR